MEQRVKPRGQPIRRPPLPGPPKTRAVELYQGYLPRPGETIAHEPSTISAHDMWSKYISKRRPVVIDGFLRDEGWKAERWTDVEYLRSKAGFAEVKIEPVHPTAGHFGTAQKRQKVGFGTFLDMLQDPKQAGKWYLTTQYEDEQDEAERRERGSSLDATTARLRPLGHVPSGDEGEDAEGPEGKEAGGATARSSSKRKRDRSPSESEEGSRGAGEELDSVTSSALTSSPPTSLDDEEELELDPVLPSPTHALADDFPLQGPEIMGKLVLQQCNLWLGISPQARSSGLHHDMHDNLYVLLAGRKRFLLFPPVAHKWLRPRGEVEWIHPNGLIVYGEEGIIPAWHPAGAGLPIVRGDGLLPIDAARWRLRARERMLKEADDKAAELAGEGAVTANRRKGKAKQTVEQALALERFQDAELALRLLLAQSNDEDDDGRSSAGSLTMENMLAFMGARASRALDDAVSSDEEGGGFSDLDEDEDEDDDDEDDDDEDEEEENGIPKIQDDGSNWTLTPSDEMALLQDAETSWVELLGPRQPPNFLLLRWRAGDAVATEILVRWSRQREQLLKALAELRSSDAEDQEEDEDEDDDEEEDEEDSPSATSDFLRMEAEGEQMTEDQIRQAIKDGKLAVADMGESDDDEEEDGDEQSGDEGRGRLAELSEGGEEEGATWDGDDDELGVSNKPSPRKRSKPSHKRGRGVSDVSGSGQSGDVDSGQSHRPPRSPPLYIPPGMLPGGLRGRLDGLADSDDEEYMDEADEFAEAMLGEIPGAEDDEGGVEIVLDSLRPEMRERIEAMLAVQGGEEDEEDDEEDGSEDEEEGTGLAQLDDDEDDGDEDDSEEEEEEDATDEEGPGLFGAASQGSGSGSDWEEADVDDGEAALAALAAQAGDDASVGALLARRQGNASDGTDSDEEDEDEDEPQSFSIVSPQDVHRYFGIPDQLGTGGNGTSKGGGGGGGGGGAGGSDVGQAEVVKQRKKIQSSQEDGEEGQAPQIHPGCPRPLVVDLRPGQMLYLPTSWFHEVTSAAVLPEEVVASTSTSNSPEAAQDDPTQDGKEKKKRDLGEFAHAALNYWFWPPTALEPRACVDEAGEGRGDWKKDKGKRGKAKKDGNGSMRSGEGRAPPVPAPAPPCAPPGGSSTPLAEGKERVGTHLSPYEDVEVWDEVRRSVDELVRDAKRVAGRQRRAAATAKAAGAGTGKVELEGREGKGGVPEGERGEGNKRRREA